jgi:lysine-N-methylase
MEGLKCTSEASTRDVGDRYSAAYDQYYYPFMDRHAHILEHYVVNHAFRNLFPFGPQSSLYNGQRSIYEEYIFLVIHYALIRSLLVGMAAYHKQDFSTDHVVKLIQSFAKAIEHNLPYLRRVQQSLVDDQNDDLAFMAILIKN